MRATEKETKVIAALSNWRKFITKYKYASNPKS